MFRERISLLTDLAQEKLKLSLSPRQVEQFALYGEMLLDWNQRQNLTRITDPGQIIVKHFLDSLVLAKEDLGRSLCDMGTGAGFPGVPVKIALPALSVTLVDSLAKRIAFLQELSRALDLPGVECVHARAEDFGRMGSSRHAFDSVASRALAALPVLLEYALPLIRVGGRFFAFKGGQAEDEVKSSRKALAVLGGEMERVEEFSLGPLAEHHSLILVRKIKETPADYPRKAGVPEKKPLV